MYWSVFEVCLKTSINNEQEDDLAPFGAVSSAVRETVADVSQLKPLCAAFYQRWRS